MPLKIPIQQLAPNHALTLLHRIRKSERKRKNYPPPYREIDLALI